MTAPEPADEVNPLLNTVLWVFILCLAVVQVFITFRGLNSPAAMDQAQIAREMAKGNGFSSLLIRPAQVQQMQADGREVNLQRVPDTFHPPLQPSIWAVSFLAAKPWWTFDSKSTVYRLDRVIACQGAVWLLLTLLLVHGMARRLFDRALANFAVLALALTKPLWDLALCGGSRGLLLFLFTLTAYWLMMLLRRAENEEPAGPLPFAIGLACAAMVMTHWMAVWLLLGLIGAAAWLLPRNRSVLLFMILLPGLALGAWLWRNWQVGGDALGMTKVLLQSLISPFAPALQMRDLENAAPPVRMAALMREVNMNVTSQMLDLFNHMLGLLPALLGFIAAFHRFRKGETGKLRWVLGLAWVGAVAGMALIGLPGKSADDNQIHAVLAPVFSIFGFAGLAVLWARLKAGTGPSSTAGVWTRHGHALILLSFSAWMAVMHLYGDLTTGLAFRDRLQQWPPYRPDTTSMLAKMVQPHELLVSDAPWAIAWYADRSCLWLPKNRAQFATLKEMAVKQGHPVAGFVITPVASQDETFISQFTSSHSEWTELVARGPILALGYDLAAHVPWLRDYPKLLPLGGIQMPDGRQVPALTFFADRERW